MSHSLWHNGLQHARLRCPSLSPRIYSNSCPLSWCCHPTITSSAALFYFCLQSFPASGLWGRRIVWCTLTSWCLVSLLSVSIIHVSVIILVGFWSWEISFIMWGCRGWGWQAAGTWVSFPWNGGIPRPHRVTWSQPINMHPVQARGRAEKPVGT